MRARALLPIVLATVVPTFASAQVCLGNPSLANAAANLGGGVGFFDGGKTFAANGTFGSELFFQGGFSVTSLDDSDLSAKAVSAGFGYEFPTQSQTSVCLGASGQYNFGLEIAGIDFTGFQIGPVLAIGVEAEVSPTTVVIPFGSLAWYRESVTADGGGPGPDEETVTDNYGSVGLGASFVFNQTLAVSPSVAIPVGDEGVETEFGLTLTVSVGRTQ